MKILTQEIKNDIRGEVTRAQVKSLIKVLIRQDINRLEAIVSLQDYLAVKFSYIMIGIERNGYAHS